KISPDRIVGQSPMSSEEYGVNKNVDLLISLGKKPETLPLPNLTGINLDTAKERIKSWGFNIGRTYSKPDSNRAKYQVISTSPSPYSHLRKGEVVNILVSSGSDSGTATAEDIKKFEFNIVSTPRVVETTKPANITSPTPASSDSNKKEQEKPGVVVESKPKENVEIVAKPVVTPASTSAVSQPQSTKPTKDVIYVMPDGFMPKEVKFIHIKPDGREQIYSGTHKPLDSIKVKVPIVPNSKIQIYINDVPVEERKID
ncbi:MAG: PASTA domain-containing protein, partial [Candidatus Riflebacteria bacterium]|nr:PASTA domain-containing protein [Candidatus Riflebacteria bacterium]